MAKLLVLVLEGWQGRMTSLWDSERAQFSRDLAESPASVGIYYTVPNMMELCWTVR